MHHNYSRRKDVPQDTGGHQAHSLYQPGAKPWTERAGTARLFIDARGDLTITCTVPDRRFAEELFASIPSTDYRADVAATGVVVSCPYAPIARTLAYRYFADIEEYDERRGR